MIVWLAIMLIMGVPGNLMVIASIVFMKHLREIPHIFVANLALFDLGVMSMDVFALIGAIRGDTFLPEFPVLCEISGIICMLSCFGSLWTMMFVAVNRFVFVCKNHIYDKIFNLKGTILTMLLIWICVFCLDLPNLTFVGLSGHAFINLNLHCSFRLDNAWWFNSIMYSGICLALPIAVISYCYVRIWMKASKSTVASQTVSTRRKREQRQLLVSLVTIFAAFVVTWVPFGVIIFLFGVNIEFANRIPFEIYLFCDLWAHSNSAFNFVIYGYTHKGFLRAYKMWLYKICPCFAQAPEEIFSQNSVTQRPPKNQDPKLELKNIPA